MPELSLSDVIDHVRAERGFDASVTTLAQEVATFFEPAPLRASALLSRDAGATAVTAIPLTDTVPHSTGSSSSFWRASPSGVPCLIDVEQPQADSVTSPHTREQLRALRVSHLVVCPISRGRVDPDVVLSFAFDRLPKKWREGCRVAQLAGPWVDRATATRTVRARRQHDPLLPVAGATMQRTLEVLEAFATLDDVLLLRGETGVGKTRLAEWAHERSNRAGRPFVTADLQGLTSVMQAARLFGARRGAWTDSKEDMPGLVEDAEGGTLFIDEIDKLDLQAQSQLLSLLDRRRYTRVGESKPRTADIRIMVGTNADLQDRCRQGGFLEDLRFRVEVLPVLIPPLRERREDLAGWAAVFLESAARGPAGLEPSAEAALWAHRWPGNLRELRSVVQRAFARAKQRGGDLLLSREDITWGINTGATRASPGEEAVLVAVDRLADHAQLVRASPGLVGRGVEGLVLCELVRRVGKREAVGRVGREASLRGDNHHKIVRSAEVDGEELIGWIRDRASSSA